MSSFSKFSNPYLPIGDSHNDGLDYVVARLGSNPNIEKVVELSSEYLQTVAGETTKASFALYYQLVSRIINENVSSPFSETLSSTDMNAQAISFIGNALAISDALTYPQILKRLESIESAIALSTLTQEEKTYPLLFVAVAKASVSYWIRQVDNPESPWIPYLPSGEDMQTFRWPWREDASGAVSGAIGGALGGPGGVASGALLGAIGGAIGASVAAAIFPD